MKTGRDVGMDQITAFNAADEDAIGYNLAYRHNEPNQIDDRIGHEERRRNRYMIVLCAALAIFSALIIFDSRRKYLRESSSYSTDEIENYDAYLGFQDYATLSPYGSELIQKDEDLDNGGDFEENIDVEVPYQFFEDENSVEDENVHHDDIIIQDIDVSEMTDSNPIEESGINGQEGEIGEGELQIETESNEMGEGLPEEEVFYDEDVIDSQQGEETGMTETNLTEESDINGEEGKVDGGEFPNETENGQDFEQLQPDDIIESGDGEMTNSTPIEESGINSQEGEIDEGDLPIETEINEKSEDPPEEEVFYELLDDENQQNQTSTGKSVNQGENSTEEVMDYDQQSNDTLYPELSSEENQKEDMEIDDTKPSWWPFNNAEKTEGGNEQYPSSGSESSDEGSNESDSDEENTMIGQQMNGTSLEVQPSEEKEMEKDEVSDNEQHQSWWSFNNSEKSEGGETTLKDQLTSDEEAMLSENTVEKGDEKYTGEVLYAEKNTEEQHQEEEPDNNGLLNNKEDGQVSYESQGGNQNNSILNTAESVEVMEEFQGGDSMTGPLVPQGDSNNTIERSDDSQGLFGAGDNDNTDLFGPSDFSNDGESKFPEFVVHQHEDPLYPEQNKNDATNLVNQAPSIPYTPVTKAPVSSTVTSTKTSPFFVANERSMEQKFGDLTDPFVKGHDVPFFWYIPRSAGTSLQTMFSRCQNLVVAGTKGSGNGVALESNLRIVEPFPKENFLNVDLRTPEGIDRASSLGAIESNLADVVFASRILQVSDIFHPPSNQARCFTMIRHPVDRAVSLFYYLKNAANEKSYDNGFHSMTIDEYASSEKAESDWMTRSLTGKLHLPVVKEEDLIEAKEFLRTKCLVGLISKFDESKQKFERYFGWQNGDFQCENDVMKDLIEHSMKYHKVRPGSSTYEALASRNRHDMMLYEYAVELFNEQM